MMFSGDTPNSCTNAISVCKNRFLTVSSKRRNFYYFSVTFQLCEVKLGLHVSLYSDNAYYTTLCQNLQKGTITIREISEFTLLVIRSSL